MAVSSVTKAARPYNVVLWGATGFTGRLAALHLVRKANPNLRVALAGRNKPKLEELRKEMLSKAPPESGLSYDIIVADIKDQKSVDKMVQDTQVVMSLAGPFMRYSKCVVDACVRYVSDPTKLLQGEPDYIQDLIHDHHDEAKKKGVRIVNCCGFDSVPYDIGTFVVAEFMNKALGAACTRVDALNGDSRGGASGGTLATVQRCIDEPRDGMMDPCILAPRLQAHGKAKARAPQLGVVYNKDCKSWTLMSVMAAINSKVVYRSADLLGGGYAPSFVYNEAQMAPGFLLCSAITAAIGMFFAGMYFKVTRFFLNLFVGTSAEGEKMKAVGKFGYHKGDPGYAATSLMCLEAALTLLETQKSVKPGDGGVLTPASALGWDLVKNLRESDFEIGVTAMTGDNAVTTQTDLTWAPRA